MSAAAMAWTGPVCCRNSRQRAATTWRHIDAIPAKSNWPIRYAPRANRDRRNAYVNTARAELGAVKLEELRFDNRYGRLPPAFHTRLSPTPLPDPYLVAFNPAAADLIGLDPREA